MKLGVVYLVLIGSFSLQLGTSRSRSFLLKRFHHRSLILIVKEVARRFPASWPADGVEIALESEINAIIANQTTGIAPS